MWTFLAAEEPASLIVPDSVQKANLAEAVNKIVNMDFSTLFGSLIRESLWILVKVLIALAIYFIGRWLVRRFLRLIDVAMQHRNVDISLRSFTRNTVSAFFTLLLILIVVSTLGVNVTSLIAVASAATLAIGMALSGTAQNFAGGVMILLMKPYRIGDYISAQGQSGTVRDIKLFSTVIATADNQTIYIPNNSIATGHHRQLFHLRDAPRGLDRGHLLRRRRGCGPQGRPFDAGRRSARPARSRPGGVGRCAGRQFGEPLDPRMGQER